MYGTCEYYSKTLFGCTITITIFLEAARSAPSSLFPIRTRRSSSGFFGGGASSDEESRTYNERYLYRTPRVEPPSTFCLGGMGGLEMFFFRSRASTPITRLQSDGQTLSSWCTPNAAAAAAAAHHSLPTPPKRNRFFALLRNVKTASVRPEGVDLLMLLALLLLHLENVPGYLGKGARSSTRCVRRM